MKKLFAKFMQDESGASLIEYVLIAAIISIVGFTVMQTIGGNVQTMWNHIATDTTAAAG